VKEIRMLHNLTDEMFAAVEEPPENDLEDVKRLAKELVHKEAQIEEAEALIAKLKQEREEIKRRSLPELMQELGISAVSADNRICKLKETVFASLPSEPTLKAAAMNWLVQNGHGGIIKRELKIDLPKGDAHTEEVVREAIIKAAPELFLDVQQKVHANSYKALARQLVKEGQVFPQDLLGVYILLTAEVEEV
jgi:hypothetical protein